MNPLKPYIMYLKIGVFAAVLAGIGYFVYDYQMRGKDLELKDGEIATLNLAVTEAVDVANNNAQVYNDFVIKSQQVLDAHLEVVEAQKKSINVSNAINERFTKGGRDIGKLAAAKPYLVQRVVNKAVKKRLECYELISRGQSDATNEFCPDYFPIITK